MSDQTVLITGISGFIAGNLANALARDEISVVGIGRKPPPAFSAPACRYLPCDIRDFDMLLKTVADIRPQTIYHLAAQSVLTSGSEEGARGTLEVNVAGTTNILEAARRVGIPAVVVASSDKQYGATAAPPYDDSDSTAFVNGGLYELSKAQQDQVARLYAGLYEVPAVRIARLVNIYGLGDTNYSRIIPGTIRRTLVGERPRLTAGPAGASLREYLFVYDAITALRALATDAVAVGNLPHRTTDGKLAKIGWNITSPHRHTAADVISAVQSVLKADFGIDALEPELLPGPTGVFEPGHQFNRDERIRTLLPGWTPRSLLDGLRHTIPWYISTPVN